MRRWYCADRYGVDCEAGVVYLETLLRFDFFINFQCESPRPRDEDHAATERGVSDP